MVLFSAISMALLRIMQIHPIELLGEHHESPLLKYIESLCIIPISQGGSMICFPSGTLQLNQVGQKNILRELARFQAAK